MRRWVNDCGRIFSRPGYEQKYLSFSDVARNKRHAQRVPSDVENWLFKFDADPIRRYGDIRVRAEVGSVERSTEYDDSFTFDLYGFGVRE